MDVTILDDAGLPCHEGEVCIRGANVTSGYINRPEANREAFTADGWFRTGDRGFMDKDGYLFLTGRLKELINRYAGVKLLRGLRFATPNYNAFFSSQRRRED